MSILSLIPTGPLALAGVRQGGDGSTPSAPAHPAHQRRPCCGPGPRTIVITSNQQHPLRRTRERAPTRRAPTGREHLCVLKLSFICPRDTLMSPAFSPPTSKPVEPKTPPASPPARGGRLRRARGHGVRLAPPGSQPATDSLITAVCSVLRRVLLRHRLADYLHKSSSSWSSWSS